MNLRILIKVTILLLLTWEISARCPSKCDCKPGSVTCSDRRLQAVPNFESLDVEPTSIDLSGCSLFEIEIYDFSFEKNTNVTELYLNNSHIVDIQAGSFQELSNLQELYLANNHLKKINRHMIKHNRNLIILDISSNDFEELPIIDSRSLEILMLINGRISKASDESLTMLPNLKFLFLQQNKLKNLNPVIFESVSTSFEVNLAFNNWECSCDTVKLFDYLKSNGLTNITRPIQCKTHRKYFKNIYYEFGVASEFEGICDEYKIYDQLYKDYNETEGDTKIDTREKPAGESLNINDYNLTLNFSRQYNSDGNRIHKTFVDILNSCDNSLRIVLFIAVPLSFLIGAFFGCYVTHMYKRSHSKLIETESNKQLLHINDKLDDNP